MRGLRYIACKIISITMHYDSDMGVEFGVSLDY